MNKSQLKRKLELLKVKSSEYSLEGNLIPDNIILSNSYNNWNVFYLDERGGRNDLKSFISEKDALEYIYSLFSESKEIEKKYLKKRKDGNGN